MKQKIVIYLATQRIHEVGGAGWVVGWGIELDGTGKFSKFTAPPLAPLRTATIRDQTLFVTAGQARVCWPIYRAILLVSAILI
jgi:hypothetical protein